jgi:cysteine-rich repeat protein
MRHWIFSVAAAAAASLTIACSSLGQPAPKTGEQETALTAEQCLYFDENGKDQICHATGSKKNPYVLLKISEHACVEAHSHHAGDYIAVGDPTCQGLGCLPEDAPCDPLVPCCGGGVCTNGVCTNLCEGVTCTPSDSCHDAGVCDQQTGICSDPVKAEGAQCDDGNACTQTDACSAGTCGGAAYSCPPAADECHVGACNGDGTCSDVSAPDGTTCCGPIPSELCDSEFHGSCQAGTCANFNACGDGFIELALGESCDDGNTTNGDGCDATCHVEPFETTAPVKISGDLLCTTAVANAARKVAVDGSGTIYAVMRCSTGANVAVSTDRGATFSDPLDLSTGIGTPGAVALQVAVAAGPSGVAYVAFMLSTGEVFLRTTQDKGATWSAGTPLGAATSPIAGLSLAAFNNDIYVGFRNSTGISVARNHNRGAGAFDITPVAMSVTFFDLIFDVRLGTLAVGADTPTFHVRTSSDGGVTFAPEVNPPGSEFFSDWAIGNGSIFVSGTRNTGTDNSTRLFLIPSGAPTTSTSVAGLPSVSASQTRSVAADDLGNSFVASQLNGGGVQLDRLAFGAAGFDTARSIDSVGGSPVAGPLPGGAGAAVVYTKGTEVWATIQAY